MIVQVTEDHISKGLRGNAKKCPIALALLDAGSLERWIINKALNEVTFEDLTVLRAITVRWKGKNKTECYCIDDYIKNFIHAFDAALPVKPFNLLLENETASFIGE
jgi:hypothetical protein